MTATPAIKRLASAANATVIQLPERRHPGIVIQGDSLHNLLSLLADSASQLHAGNYEEVAAVIEEVRDIVAGYVSAYDAAIATSAKSGPND